MNRLKRFMVLLLAIVSVFMFTGCGESVEELCKKGEYQKAYEKADDSEKDIVINEWVENLCSKGEYIQAYEKALETEKEKIKAESVAAEVSAVTTTMLKDPYSFKLREAYYTESINDDGDFVGHLVLYLSGANAYGVNISKYWWFEWDRDKQIWSCGGYFSDLIEDHFDSDDNWTYKDLFGEASGNLYKVAISATMETGIKLDKKAINRINNLHEEGMLDEIKKIPTE